VLLRRRPAPSSPGRLHYSPLFWLAAATALIWVASSLEMGLGSRTIRLLRTLPPLPAGEAPSLSVVIAARNEQEKIAAALRSVLRQDYPGLEVIVVDDRSTDSTGTLLDELAVGEPRLRVVHLDALPHGWLGKNHALMRGAGLASGEWILFTDADVVLAPTATARAVGYAVRERLDHLTVTPRLEMPSAALDAFAGTFAILFARYARPWRARDPRSRSHVGIGAFNLVRTEAYRAIDGHRRLAMRPDDDLKLGKVLKRAGFRQDVAFGSDMVSVEWYATVGEAVRGLEKNTFAGLDYSVAAVLASCALLLTLDAWPFFALLVTRGATRMLEAVTVATILLTYAASTRGSRTNPLLGLAYPLAILLFVFILLRSTFLALRNGGIRWRDTLYPLDELRANRV
jgi:hypothetical protein